MEKLMLIIGIIFFTIISYIAGSAIRKVNGKEKESMFGVIKSIVIGFIAIWFVIKMHQAAGCSRSSDNYEYSTPLRGR